MENEIKNKEKFKKVKIILTRMGNLTKKEEKSFKKFILNTSLALIFILSIGTAVFGADPTLVTKINSGLKKVQGYLIKFATPAAGVAIASGVLMRKFSFGNEEKMAIGKKIIINAIIGYAIVISIDLIIKFVDSLL